MNYAEPYNFIGNKLNNNMALFLKIKKQFNYKQYENLPYNIFTKSLL